MQLRAPGKDTAMSQTLMSVAIKKGQVLPGQSGNSGDFERWGGEPADKSWLVGAGDPAGPPQGQPLGDAAWKGSRWGWPGELFPTQKVPAGHG